VSESSKSIVIIPTYNEVENVDAISRAIISLEKSFDILFIDDNSPDGTSEAIKKLMSEFSGRIFLEQRTGKLGLGTAYIHGFKWAINNNYNYVIEMDCDFSHDPNDLPRLLKSCQDGADVSIGSRYCKGGRVKNWPIDRILMSYFASIYVRLILWIGIKDTTAGFKCFNADVLKKIKLDNIIFKGYAFQICMKYAAIKHGFKVKEIPITFVDRIYGESKMSTGIFKEAFFGVWKMRKMNL
jgi:dolichol-phosphate mannosyltransferase